MDAPTLPAGLARSYQVTGTLGQGGSSVVLAAIQLALKRPVVIKLLDRGDAVMDERFRREAVVLASLSDPGILPVLDFGVDEGRGYLVTPHVEARPLSEEIKSRGRFPWPEAARIAAAVARSLATAHAAGVVHRDLKPANILLTPSDRPLLIDFGLAHAADAVHLTIPGEFVGTPRYASPEQFSGQSVDARSDLYSFGHILFELLAGRHAIVASSMAELIEGQMVRRVECLPPGVVAPARLEALVVQLLAKAPADRPASAEAVRHALDAVLVDAGEIPGTSGSRELAAFGAPPAARSRAPAPRAADERAKAEQGRAGAGRPSGAGAGAARADVPRRTLAITAASVMTLVVMLALSWVARRPAPKVAGPGKARTVAGHRRIVVAWRPRDAADLGSLSWQRTEGGESGVTAAVAGRDGGATATLLALEPGAEYRLTVKDAAGVVHAPWNVRTKAAPEPASLRFELTPGGQVRAVDFRTAVTCMAQVLGPESPGTESAARRSEPGVVHRLGVPPERARVGFRIALWSAGERFLFGPYDADLGAMLRGLRPQLDASHLAGELDAVFAAVAKLSLGQRAAELASRLHRLPAVQLLGRLRPYIAGLDAGARTTPPWRRELLPALRMGRELVRTSAFARLHGMLAGPLDDLLAALPQSERPAGTPVQRVLNVFDGRLLIFGALSGAEDHFARSVDVPPVKGELWVRLKVETPTTACFARLVVTGHDPERPADRGLTEEFCFVRSNSEQAEVRLLRLDPVLAACRRLSFDLQLGALPGPNPFVRNWVGPMDLVSPK